MASLKNTTILGLYDSNFFVENFFGDCFFFMFLCFFMFCDVQALGIETEEDICKLSTYFMHIPEDRPDEHEKVGIWN